MLLSEERILCYSEQPPLCNDQVSHGATWKSAKDVWPSTAFDFSIPARQIQQRVVSDCSVCAAIAVCIEHHRRFESRVRLSCSFLWISYQPHTHTARILLLIPTQLEWAPLCNHGRPLLCPPHVERGNATGKYCLFLMTPKINLMS